MAAPFSWSDTIQIAFSSCLPCLSRPSTNPGASASTDSLVNNPTAHRIPRARADELQGLLADSDAEAERMSLHSNPGRGTKRTKRKKSKQITVFGYDLFGRAPPPIHLPESDDEGVGRSLGIATPTTRSSSLTFDSDAAPLDSAAIANISNSTAALRAREEAEEEELRAKAERREKRRQRKELKRVAKELALAEQSEEFQGFQGSGDGFPPEEYGPFVKASNEDDEGAANADLDGGVYARKSSNGNGSGSDSRSRTSASRSQQSQSDHSYLQRVHQRQSPETQRHGPAPVDTSSVAPRKKPKSKSSTKTRSTASRASRSNTSGSTSQSPSLASPTSATFPGAGNFPKPNPSIVDDEFDGSQGLTEMDLPSHALRGAFPSTGLRAGFSPSQFPSPGLAGAPKIERRDSLLARGGAFLATRGDMED
ncbi:hypothetical protein LshimejAT787_0605470 [Lyophyllum shimeji]|uniref:Uncharacterized protein n=1 Tax=Lyophyllum shimeji TaxID=47721 RepID=A0A9P3UPT4_LYOSH|nr:hypothetical protein LshimejAT787_0605470 [Lyophyllum shimeji]